MVIVVLAVVIFLFHSTALMLRLIDEPEDTVPSMLVYVFSLPIYGRVFGWW